MPRHVPVTPDCCHDVGQHCTVFLSWSFAPLNPALNPFEGKPSWFALGQDMELGCPVRVSVCVCPHCGTRLPAIEKVDDVGIAPVCAVSDGGYHCDTCRERLVCCRCYPPETRWQPQRKRRGKKRVPHR